MDYFKRLKNLLDEHEILLVDDEVQAGVGRTAKWFAIEHFDVVPDVVAIAKPIASGLPLGITVASKELMEWPGGSHASTYGANPLACAAAHAVLDEIEDRRLMENALRQGDYILRCFEEMKDGVEIIGDVRGLGLMIGVEVVKDKASKEPGWGEAREIMKRSWRKGVAMVLAGASTLRVAPPLTITRELVDTALEIIEESVRQVNAESARGK